MRRIIVLVLAVLAVACVLVWHLVADNRPARGVSAEAPAPMEQQRTSEPAPSVKMPTGPAPTRPAAVSGGEASARWSSAPDLGAAVDNVSVNEVVEDARNCRTQCGASCMRDREGALHCGKPCTRDRDCGADAVCFPTTTNIARCTSSQCAGVGQDSECEPGWTCLAMSRAAASTYVCAKAGVRAAGESCIGIGNERSPAEGLCGPGLFCVEGVCLPQKCALDSDCPKGARCSPDPGGLLPHMECLPACTVDTDCAAGMKCVEHPPGRKACADVTRATCLVSGCEAGTTCAVTLPLLSQLRAECVKPCVPDEPSACATDEVCLQRSYGSAISSVCEKVCSPDGPPCPAGRACVALESGPATCQAVVSGPGRIITK